MRYLDISYSTKQGDFFDLLRKGIVIPPQARRTIFNFVIEVVDRFLKNRIMQQVTRGQFIRHVKRTKMIMIMLTVFFLDFFLICVRDYKISTPQLRLNSPPVDRLNAAHAFGVKGYFCFHFRNHLTRGVSTNLHRAKKAFYDI